MARFLTGSSLLLVEAVTSGFQIASHASPWAILGTMGLAALTAYPTLTGLADLVFPTEMDGFDL